MTHTAKCTHKSIRCWSGSGKPPNCIYSRCMYMCVYLSVLWEQWSHVTYDLYTAGTIIHVHVWVITTYPLHVYVRVGYHIMMHVLDILCVWECTCDSLWDNDISFVWPCGISAVHVYWLVYVCEESTGVHVHVHTGGWPYCAPGFVVQGLQPVSSSKWRSQFPEMQLCLTSVDMMW